MTAPTLSADVKGGGGTDALGNGSEVVAVVAGVVCTCGASSAKSAKGLVVMKNSVQQEDTENRHMNTKVADTTGRDAWARR